MKEKGPIQSKLDNGQCPRCHCNLPAVEVHGHIQCQVCHLYISECCNGETGETDVICTNRASK